MEINNSDIVSIFNKLGGKYYVRIPFINQLERVVFEKLVKRFIYSEERGGLSYEYNMDTVLVVESDKTKYKMEIPGKNE